MLRFNIRHQTIRRADTFRPVKNSRNYLYAEFDFLTDDWSRYGTKTALFKGAGMNESIAVILDGQGKALVPWEVLEKDSFTVSVFAGDLITAGIVEVHLYESGYESGRDVKDPTPSVYQQIIELLKTKGDGHGAREIELRNDGSHIQWRYVGDGAWMDLVPLDDIRGTDGSSPIKGVDYFTEEEISAIANTVETALKEYIDVQIGGVLNGSY